MYGVIASLVAGFYPKHHLPGVQNQSEGHMASILPIRFKKNPKLEHRLIRFNLKKQQQQQVPGFFPRIAQLMPEQQCLQQCLMQGDALVARV